jgi:hypothetical protein
VETAAVDLGLAQAHLGLGQGAALGGELRGGEVELLRRDRVVEPRQGLPLLDRHALLDRHLDHLAGDLRGNRRLAPGGDVARGVQDCAGGGAGAQAGLGRLDLGGAGYAEPRPGDRGDEHQRDGGDDDPPPAAAAPVFGGAVDAQALQRFLISHVGQPCRSAMVQVPGSRRRVPLRRPPSAAEAAPRGARWSYEGGRAKVRLRRGFYPNPARGRVTAA